LILLASLELIIINITIIKGGGGRKTTHRPEVVLNNFNTRLGHSIGRMFAALVPHAPEFIGRQVVTFHNQRDFIFFRYHR